MSARVDHLLGHKASHKCKRTEIIKTIFSDHNRINWEINKNISSKTHGSKKNSRKKLETFQN